MANHCMGADVAPRPQVKKVTSIMKIILNDKFGFWGNVQILITIGILPTGCSHSPSQDILGSFFPAWMLCALGGIILTIVTRHLIVKAGIDALLPVRLILYVGLAISLTFILWLVWYGN